MAFHPVLALTLIELLALLAFIALLIWLWTSSRSSGSGTTTLMLPPAYPPVSGSSSIAAGALLIPQGSWSGVTRQQRRTSEDYTFLRQTYDPASPSDPYAASPGLNIRFRLEAAPGERVEITAVTGGQAAGGSGWWAGVTNAEGKIVVTVYADGREEDPFAITRLKIIAEEVHPDGSVPRGAVHTVELVPSGH